MRQVQGYLDRPFQNTAQMPALQLEDPIRFGILVPLLPLQLFAPSSLQLYRARWKTARACDSS